MIEDALALVFSVLRQSITWLGRLWSSVGNFQPMFIAIFTGIVVFNFIVVPMLVFRQK